MTTSAGTIAPMAPKLTDDERRAITEAIQAGESCVSIAKRFGRSNDTVSRIGKTIGWRFGESNLSRAHEARSAYSAERRADIARRLTLEAEALLDELHREHVAYNFGGKDNDYNEHTFDEPPVDAKRTIVVTVKTALDTVLAIDKHDSKSDDGMAAVDAWLEAMTNPQEQSP